MDFFARLRKKYFLCIKKISCMNFFFELIDVEPFVYGLEFKNRINLKVSKGEHLCVVGSNGSGKTKFGEMLCGKVPIRAGKALFSFLPSGSGYVKDKVIKVGFESAYTMADYSNMYYQQRFSSTENEWNSLENKKMPTVKDLLDNLNGESKSFWIEKLRLEQLFDRTLIMLSSGELRRFLIANILIKKPEIIIFDNPFIGLDFQNRKELNELFKEISLTQQMIFLVPDVNEIPEVSKTVLPCKNLEFFDKMSKEEFLADKSFQQFIFEDKFSSSGTLLEPYHSLNRDFKYAAILKDISIKYPKRTLFENLNWEIKKGEKWILSGSNGSGKSTLLSLITADNPRSYNMDITLFDRKRGTGESIWDIKKRIGYISSEMHLYFRENQLCKKVVASGFFDTQGLFRECSPQQFEMACRMLAIFGIGGLSEKPFLKISDAEQRIVLLARTMIKNPDLLILDEPLHGLDPINKKRAKYLIDMYAAQEDRTLVFVTHNSENIPSCITDTFKL